MRSLVWQTGQCTLPFGAFDRLHFARFVILEDATLGDIALLGLPVPALVILRVTKPDFPPLGPRG